MNCPVCNHRFDTHTSANGLGVSPSPGDISVCLYCAMPLVFREDLSLAEATVQDLANLDKETIRVLNRTQQFIRLRRP